MKSHSGSFSTVFAGLWGQCSSVLDSIGQGLYQQQKKIALSNVFRRCFAFGFPLTIFGILIQIAGDFDSDVAIIGQVPNTIATIPIAIGYVAIITLLNMRPDNRFKARIRSVGQMALTNYITQSNYRNNSLRYTL